MTRSPLRLPHRPGRRGSLARRAGSLLAALGLSVLPLVVLPAAPAVAAPTPGTGANFIATGHDQDWHCQNGGSTPSCQFLKLSVDAVRKGSTLPVLSISSGTKILTNALIKAGVTPVVEANPRDAAAFNAVPLVDGSGNKLYSAIVVGSSAGVADINASDSANINARKADIKTFFNAGGGILAESGAGQPGYYDFVPITINAVSVRGPFTVAARGAELGFTSGMVNCCATHNSFSTPTAPVEVLETDSAGTATTIAAFDAKITDGGFSVAPVVTITGGDTVYTSMTSPMIEGTTDAPVGSTVTVTIAGQTLTTTVATGGTWMAMPTALVEGSYPVVASITVDGKTGTGTQTLIIDTTAPTVAIDGGGTRTTNDTTPTFSGTTTAPVGSTVTVTVGSQTLAATVLTGGTWSVTFAALSEGSYTVSATAVDQAGNVSTPATQALVLDLTPPGLGIDGGASVGTHHGDQPITGTSDAPAGSTVTVTVGGQTLTGAVSDTGTWSVTPAELEEGDYTITASVTDPAGNVATATQAYEVDTTPPALTIDGADPAFTNSRTPTISGTTDAPVDTVVTVVIGDLPPMSATVGEGGVWSVTAPTDLPDGEVEISATVFDEVDNVTTVTRSLTVDTVSPLLTVTGGSRAATNDPTPTISGTTDAADGTVVTVAIGSETYYPTVLDGRWTVTPGEGPTGLPDGEYDVTVSIEDPAGNLTTVSQALVVDREAPSLAFDVPGSVISNTGSPTISGTSDAPTGSRVVVTAGSAEVSTTVGEDGTWSVELPDLDDGEYVVRATVTDEAENTSSEAQLSLLVDTVAPAGAVTSPALTGSTTPTISGTTDAPVGSPVLLTIDGAEYDTVVGEGGVWSLTLDTPLAEGDHQVVVGFIDEALNITTVEQVLTVDLTPPTGDLDGGTAPLGNSKTPAISGTTDAPAGSTVVVTVSGLTLTTTVGADGTWSVTVPEPGLGDGGFPVTVVITDPAGNARTLTQSVVVDTTPPGGSFDGGDTRTVTAPSLTISGTSDAPAGSPVVVTVGGLTLTTTVGEDGTWSVEAIGLLVGDYTVTATITDPAGNITVLDQHLTVAEPAPTSTSTTPTTSSSTTSTSSSSSSSTPVWTSTTTVIPLAYTGTDMTLPLTGGIGLLAVGAGLALASRRRRTRGEHV